MLTPKDPGNLKNGISIIIPAWNESSKINLTIDGILSLPYKGFIEIIVVDGSPEGDTANAIKAKNIKKLFSEKGRAKQMNKGALNSNGEVLLFLHADTLLPKDSLQRISGIMDKKGIVAGAFDLGIQSKRIIFRLIEAAASLRSRITRIPYGDQAIFIRKKYFQEIGGFKEIPLMEDVELMRRIKKAGNKIYIISDKVMTSSRRWEKEGILYCTLRNWLLVTLYYLGVKPDKLMRFYH